MNYRVEVQEGASSPELLAFRTRILRERYGEQAPPLDAERDLGVRIFVLYRDDEIVGTIRHMRLSDITDRDALIERFEMLPAVDRFGVEHIGVTGRFLLDQSLSMDGTPIAQLVMTMLRGSCDLGLRVNFSDCGPSVLPFYERLGFRRYSSAFRDSLSGYKLPLVMLLRDAQWLKRVGSPLAEGMGECPGDDEARIWFERHYPEFRDTSSAAYLPKEDFFSLLAGHVGANPVSEVKLLQGLSEAQAQAFLRSATVMHVAPNDRIIRQGEHDETLFVMLKGLAEVYRDEVPTEVFAVIGQGDTFGEIGLVSQSIRSANVTARTECEVLVLSSAFLAYFQQEEPATAAQVFLNLSRIMADRLAVMASELALCAGGSSD